VSWVLSRGGNIRTCHTFTGCEPSTENPAAYKSCRGSETFGYDGVDRLTSAVATGSVTYNLQFGTPGQPNGQYDQYGNMSCTSQGGSYCTQLQFDPSNNRLTWIGDTQLDSTWYDASGDLLKNQTTLTTHTFQWDAEGRLASVGNGATEAKVYNALGQEAEV
jgi:YD repeat-containing protein